MVHIVNILTLLIIVPSRCLALGLVLNPNRPKKSRVRDGERMVGGEVMVGEIWGLECKKRWYNMDSGANIHNNRNMIDYGCTNRYHQDSVGDVGVIMGPATSLLVELCRCVGGCALLLMVIIKLDPWTRFNCLNDIVNVTK